MILMKFQVHGFEYTIQTTKGKSFIKNRASDKATYKVLGPLDNLPSSYTGLTLLVIGETLNLTKGYITADPAGKEADAVLCDFFIAIIESVEHQTIQSLAQSLDQSTFTQKTEILRTIFSALSDVQKAPFLQGLSQASLNTLQLPPVARQATQAPVTTLSTAADDTQSSAHSEGLYPIRLHERAAPAEPHKVEHTQRVTRPHHTFDLNQPVTHQSLPSMPTDIAATLSFSNASADKETQAQQFLDLAQVIFAQNHSSQLDVRCDPREKRALLTAIMLAAVSRVTINTESITITDLQAVFATQSPPPVDTVYQQHLAPQTASMQTDSDYTQNRRYSEI